MRVLVVSVLFPGLLTSAAQAALLTPSPYLAFEAPAAGASISPFADVSFEYFHLENFQDQLLNTPGVVGTGGVVIGPGGLTDSVDEDDGAIDGSGTQGRSYFSGAGSTGVSFTFNAASLGSLPTHVGIVWTDGLGQVTFSAYDANGVSLGQSTASPATPGSYSGQTDEDTFFGIFHAGGVSRIHISNANGGIEVDHLQYGSAATAVVPEPSSLILLCGGLPLVASCLRRRKSGRV